MPPFLPRHDLRLRASPPGIYLVGAHVRWLPNGVLAFRDLALVKNRTIVLARDTRQGDSLGTTDQTLTALAELAAGDFVEVMAQQNTTAPALIGTFPDWSPSFWMTLSAPVPSE